MASARDSRPSDVGVADVSERQRVMLERLSQRHYPPEFVVRRMVDLLLEELPEDEPLLPEWQELWGRYRRLVRRMVPEDVIERLDRRVKGAIAAVDDEVHHIRVDGDTKVTFLLGAGASAPSGIPTVDGLLSELWNRARKIGREDLDRLAHWCHEREITNIEDLLTAAYISNFAARNAGITSLLDYFLFSGRRQDESYTTRRRLGGVSQANTSSIAFLQDTLQTLFGLLASTMIPANPNPTHEAIVRFVKEHDQTSIITTNYDGCMDEAILKGGLAIKRTAGIAGGDGQPSNGVSLIKMHGSINWAHCESCQEVREFDLLQLKQLYTDDEMSYPVIGICKNCGGLRRPLLVPPLSLKFLMFPHLVEVWNSARQAIDSADYLIVVGYSFSEADTYITKIISRSISMNEPQRVVVVDIDAKLVPSLRERFAAQIDGFDERRILSACQSSDKILPKILESMVGKPPRKKPAKKQAVSEKASS